jgi:hypothetical protein
MQNQLLPLKAIPRWLSGASRRAGFSIATAFRSARISARCFVFICGASETRDSRKTREGIAFSGARKASRCCARDKSAVISGKQNSPPGDYEDKTKAISQKERP